MSDAEIEAARAAARELRHRGEKGVRCGGMEKEEYKHETVDSPTRRPRRD